MPRIDLRAVTGVAVALILYAAGTAADSPLTPGEEGGYSRFTQAPEVAGFLSRLAAGSPQLQVQTVGRTGATSTFDAEDLYLAILTAEGVATPTALDRGKPTLFLFASQHGDEQSAKEAALALVRDLAVGELRPLLERLNVLVLPQSNPFGNFVDQRRNEQDLDLNRDHIKLEAPATAAIHRVFHHWLPEVTVDAHEKGDDYYRASYGCVSNLNIHQRLQEICRQVLLAEVDRDLATRGIPFHEYLVTQTMGIDSSSGAALADDVDQDRPTMKRFSTTDLNDGRNSLGIFETLSLILEGASRQDLATLGERTGWQRAALASLLASVARHGEEIVGTLGELRRALVERGTRYSAEDLVHLRLDYVRSASEPTLTLHRFVAAEAPIVGVLKEPRQAGEAVTRDDLELPPHGPLTTVEEELVEHWFPGVQATLSIPRPLGYVVPAGHRLAIETLLRLGVEVHLFTREVRLPLEVHRVRRIVPSAYDYLAPEELESELEIVESTVAAGSFYISTAQLAANLVVVLLEPQSEYGLIRYRKLGLVPAAGATYPFARHTGSAALPLVRYKGWAGGA